MFSTVEASRLFFYLCVFDSFSSFFSLSLSYPSCTARGFLNYVVRTFASRRCRTVANIIYLICNARFFSFNISYKKSKMRESYQIIPISQNSTMKKGNKRNENLL